MSERLVSISMCLACPYFLEDSAGKECLLCEKHFDDSFEGNYIPDWCELQVSDKLPEWVKNAIENEVGQNLNKRSQLFYCGFVQALNWVLTLRKPVGE